MKTKIVKLKSWEKHFMRAEKTMKGASLPDEYALALHVINQQFQITELRAAVVSLQEQIIQLKSNQKNNE